MYDPASIRTITASENAASNGLLTTHGRILIHKVTLNKDASNAVFVTVFDAATATGTAIIGLSVATATLYDEANFDPPVPFEVGLSTTITGNGGTLRFHYTPA